MNEVKESEESKHESYYNDRSWKEVIDRNQKMRSIYISNSSSHFARADATPDKEDLAKIHHWDNMLQK